VQGVKPVLPQGPVAAQPVIDLGQRLGAQTVDPPLRLLADVDQTRLRSTRRCRDTPGRTHSAAPRAAAVQLIPGSFGEEAQKTTAWPESSRLTATA